MTVPNVPPPPLYAEPAHMPNKAPTSVSCTGTFEPPGVAETSRFTLCARYRKFAVAAVGAAAAIVSLNLVHGTAQTWLVGLLAAASALGVYRVPNVQVAPTPPTDEGGVKPGSGSEQSVDEPAPTV